MRRAGRDLALDRVAHDGVLEQRQLAVEHGDVDLGRFAGLEAMHQGGIDRDRSEQARADVADRHADARRRLALVAGDAHDAAHALDHHVVGGVLGVEQVASRGRGVDQLGILLVQRVPAVARFSIVPGRKFSTITSAFSSSFSKILRSASALRSSAMLSLPRLTEAK